MGWNPTVSTRGTLATKQRASGSNQPHAPCAWTSGHARLWRATSGERLGKGALEARPSPQACLGSLSGSALTWTAIPFGLFLQKKHLLPRIKYT